MTDHAAGSFDIRMRCVIALALLLPLGLATRTQPYLFWPLVAEHGGDALWCAAVLIALRAVFTGMRPGRVALLAFALAAGVEFSQLYQADWLNALRRTLVGRLTLGSGFVWIDFARYAGGALIGHAVDVLLLKVDDPA